MLPLSATRPRVMHYIRKTAASGGRLDVILGFRYGVQRGTRAVGQAVGHRIVFWEDIGDKNNTVNNAIGQSIGAFVDKLGQRMGDIDAFQAGAQVFTGIANGV